MNPSLQSIPLLHIHCGHGNLRLEPGADLDGLAASIGTRETPNLVQPPILEQTGNNEYAIIAGERRILAARQAGWQSVLCIVHPRLDPMQAHRLRLAENLHRKDLHPLDEAAAIKIAWLIANAEALSLSDEVRAILEQHNPPAQTLTTLKSLLETNGFSPNHPAVTWDTLLTQLGLDLDAERRKKLLGVLRVDNVVQKQVRSLKVTEAGLRAIGTLGAEDQQRLVAEITEDPALAHKVRRIARVVRDGSYTMDEALAEARGQAPGEAPNEDPNPSETGPVFSTEPGNSQELLLDDRPMSAAMELLEIANRLSTALAVLIEVSGGNLAVLPKPWGEYSREALDLIRSETSKFIQENQKGT